MVCTGPVHILVMVTVMMMIEMKAATEEMKIEMVMGEKENGAAEMMTGMVEMGTRMVMKVIGMVEILMSDTAEMVTRMMITGEEVKTMRTTSMALEVGVLIEMGTVLLMMRATIHLGEHCFNCEHAMSFLIESSVDFNGITFSISLFFTKIIGFLK